MPNAPPDPRRRCLKFDEWPAIDRRLWETGLQLGADLDDNAYAASLRPATLTKVQEGYGRWLGFLAYSCDLDALATPSDRVTRKQVAAFFRLMRQLGNRDYTLIGRLVELQSALRIMQPEEDFSWLTSPDGLSVRARLRMAKRPIQLYGSDTLYRWGIRMMDEAATRLGPKRRQVQFRDGLLIALLAARPLRLHPISILRLGQHVIRCKDRFRIVLGPYDDKIDKSQEPYVPAGLTPYVHRYLEVERIELLNGHTSDWFWVNWDGQQLAYRGIDKRIRWCSKKEFGQAFGPHHFRHEMGTTGPMLDPASPGTAAAIMGITTGVHEKHYNRGKQTEAANGFHAGLRRERRDTEGTARRAFESQD